MDTTFTAARRDAPAVDVHNREEVSPLGAALAAFLKERSVPVFRKGSDGSDTRTGGRQPEGRLGQDHDGRQRRRRSCLAEQGRSVLLVDLDAQASASAWLGVRALDDGLLGVFTGDTMLRDLAVPTGVEGLSLVAASPNLRDTAVAQAIDIHHALRRAAPAEGEYDYVLLDCPPALGHVVIAALAAAHQLLVPVAAHAMELDGLAAVHRTAEAVRARINPGLEIRVLACRVDGRTRLAGEVVATLRANLGAAVLSSVVRENVRVAEAPSHMQPVLAYAPSSAGAEDYRAVASELAGVSASA